MAKKTIVDFIQHVPMAITPSKQDEIDTFIEMRVKGENKTEIDALANGSSGDEREPYQFMEGVAVIPVFGVLAKRMNLITMFSGGTSMELLRKDFQAALDDPAVKSILLNVESPGGTVDGTKETADLIFNARGQKPIVAFGNGLMASAAMWIGSAADYIVADESAQLGSISVIMEHIDVSGQDQMRGIKKTRITTGKYKAISSDEKPLSQEGLDYLQAIAGYYHTMFVEGMAKNLGIDADTVQNKMADGRIFIGQQAVDVGLADRTGTYEDALNIAREKAESTNTNITAQEESTMTKDELKKDHRAAYDAIFEEGKVEGKAAAESEALETVAAERDTEVLGLVKAAFGDETEAKLKGMLDANMTASQIEAAKAVLGGDAAKAETTTKKDILAAIEGKQGDALANAENQGDAAAADFMALVKVEMKASGCSLAEAQKTVRAENEPAYEKWIAAQQKK